MKRLIPAVWALCAFTCIAQAAPSPAFKGSWQGPAQLRLPGPGPAPGQSLPDYFAGLHTGPRAPVPLHVLVLGGSHGFHHDSTSVAMASVLQWGRESGLWITELRTDFTLVNASGGRPMNAGFQPTGLVDFDAVVVANAEGDWGLRSDQKAALLAFVHERGKGLVVMHAGIDANHDWHDYIDMLGAEMTGHPFNTLDHVLLPFTLVNEAPAFPAVAHLAPCVVKQDELYVLRNFSRSDIDVLLRMDVSRLDTTGVTDQLPPDRDVPVAWVHRYGRGRVFASTLGHSIEAYADPDIARMYEKAIEWALGLSVADDRPHPPRNGCDINPSRETHP